MRAERRRAALVAGLAGLYALGLHGHLIVGHDQAQYVVLGDALASGRGYRQIQVVGEPLFTRMPPGLPALLAAASLVGMPGLWLQHLLVILISAAALPGVYRLAQPVVGCGGALGVTTLTALNASFYALAHQTLSEGPYTALLVLTLLLAVRTRDRPEPRAIAALIALTALAIHVRTIGFALIPAVVAALASGLGSPRTRLARVVAYAGTTAVLVLPWTLYTLDPPESSNYSYVDVLTDSVGPSWIQTTPARVGVNAVRLLAAIGDLSFVTHKLARVLPLPGATSVIAGAVVLALTVTGLTRRGWGHARGPVVAYVVAHVLMIFVWSALDARMLTPLLPLLLLCAWRGGRDLWLRWRAARPALAGLGVGAAAVNGIAIVFLLVAGDADSHRGTLVAAGLAQRDFLLGDQRDLWLAAEWSGRRTVPGGLVVSRFNQVVYLAGGRPTLGFRRDSLEDPRARFVIADDLPTTEPHEWRLLQDLRRSPPSSWRRAVTFGQTRILAREGAGDSVSDTPSRLRTIGRPIVAGERGS